MPLLLCARTSGASRWLTLCMMLIRASRVLCAQRPSGQISGPCVPPIVTLLMLTSVKGRVPRWMQKKHDQFVKVRPRTTIKRTPSLALHAMCLGIDLTVRPRLSSSQMSCCAC